MLPLREAKEIVRRLGIKNGLEYRRLHTQGKLPKGIPFGPHQAYKNKGWNGWSDFKSYGYKSFSCWRIEDILLCITEGNNIVDSLHR
jgi:hypothetical protein